MKARFTILTTFSLLLLSGIANAQLITTNPAFPADNSAVEIIFNAALGNAGLAGYTGDVYAHTGVITNLSSGTSDWKYVKTNWGVNSPATKLERIGQDLYKLIINPDIRQYYVVPASEQILQMAFVFRSGVQVGGSWLEGKTETGGDIFADVYPSGLFTRINLPSEEALLINSGVQFNLEAASNTADSMFLYINDILRKSVQGNSLTEVIIAEGSGKFRLKITAKNSTETASDSMYYYIMSPVTVMELPAGIADGINYISDTEATLCLYAPEKENAFIIGDFNNWEFDESGFMYRTPDGNRYWRTLQNLTPGTEYIFQYVVDGSIRIGDPYAEKVSDPWNDKYISESTYPGILDYPSGKAMGVATVLQTGQEPYQWVNNNFPAPEKEDLIIYELLVRDFLAKHDYQTLIDTLGYLKRLGVNAIELMPVSEFEGNLSWGYNPNFYFAPDKYYGPENDLKRFIDECHAQGFAVIIDMVLNHSFGTSPMVMLYWDAANNRPAANNPWFNPVAKHDYNVGFDFNHESPATAYLVDRVVKYWIDEYKVDGYRFDLSKGFTQKNTLGNVGAWGQYDASRIAIWKRIADSIWTAKSDAYVILEHFADNTEEKELATYGMMIWGNSNGNFADAAKGSASNTNFSWASYKARGWSVPNLVSYMESHDEERIMVKVLKEGNTSNPAYNLRDSTNAMERMQLASVFLYCIPGPKMIWQFGELGYDYPIEFNGRTGEKPIRWDYLNDYRRKTLFNVVAEILKLRKEHNAFSTTDYTLNVSGYQKKINLNHPDMSVVLLGNFNVVEGEIVPGFPQTGKWYEYFTGDSIDVVSGNDPISLQGGEYRLYTSRKLAKPETGLAVEEIRPDGTTMLGKAFPNPSTSVFTIPVSIRQSTFTHINVYDINGRLITDVYKGILQPGQRTFEWNAEGQKPGLYLLKLVTDTGVQSTVLILR
ncbi:MAG: T9SS type A sorting domain-containing protein [Bacteroidales bacterium]|nr:T9SS type A sorting domain-containing protein [Bacteroidales bacterium]